MNREYIKDKPKSNNHRSIISYEGSINKKYTTQSNFRPCTEYINYSTTSSHIKCRNKKFNRTYINTGKILSNNKIPIEIKGTSFNSFMDANVVKSPTQNKFNYPSNANLENTTIKANFTTKQEQKNFNKTKGNITKR